MGNTDTTTKSQSRLTTEDIKHLDIEELLNGIFAGDVDVKSVLRKGLSQIEHTEALQARFEAEALKAIAAHERSIKRAQNAPVNAARVKVAATGTMTVLAGIAAVRLASNPWGWGLLAAAGAIRTAKYWNDLNKVKFLREIERKGETVEVASDEEVLKDILGEARFETLLGLADTAAMTTLGIAGAGPAWLVLGVIQALVTGHNATIWAGAQEALKPDADTIELPLAFRRPVGKVVPFQRTAVV